MTQGVHQTSISQIKTLQTKTFNKSTHWYSWYVFVNSTKSWNTLTAYLEMLAHCLQIEIVLIITINFFVTWWKRWDIQPWTYQEFNVHCAYPLPVAAYRQDHTFAPSIISAERKAHCNLEILNLLWESKCFPCTRWNGLIQSTQISWQKKCIGKLFMQIHPMYPHVLLP